ncbi:MAG: hypothetical protein Ta2A_19060 [Treponemataceae bacterium]|nr:MAG: hypothetical protein Ta2A_19060 [Treponemataceae bacterium]
MLFNSRKNDISFLLDEKIVILIEHQSTINENMALRFLIYIARIYEKLVDNESLYRRKQVPIPQPEFIVLYNGTEDYPEQSEIKLSDAFINNPAASSGIVVSPEELHSGVHTLFSPQSGRVCTPSARIKAGIEKPALDLTVKIYNINTGKNLPLLQKSKSLNDYAAFTAKVREFQAELKGNFDSKQALEEALKKAIQWCVKQNILKHFLQENGSEVENMVFGEWDMGTALKVAKEEGVEEGMEKGMEKAWKRDGKTVWEAFWSFLTKTNGNTLSKNCYKSQLTRPHIGNHASIPRHNPHAQKTAKLRIA